jgi:MFS family permease
MSSTRHSLAWFNRSLMLRAVFDTVCGGTTFILVAFALSVGIAGESMPRITAALSLGCLFQMLSLPLVQRLADRKRFVVQTGSIEPLVVIAAVLTVPLLPQWMRLGALAVAMFAAASFLHMNKPIVDDWVASTVPGGIRGKFLGRRWQLYNVVLLIATLLAGWAGDVVRGDTYGLAGLLAIGGAFGTLAVIAVSKAHMPMHRQATALRWADLKTIWTHRPFRRFVAGQMLYNSPFFLAAPFYQVYYIETLQMPPSGAAYVAVLYTLTKVTALQFCGGWVDRVTPRIAVTLVAPTYIVFFALLGVSQPDQLWTLFAAFLLIGPADGVFAVCTQSSLYATVPQQGARPAFFAAYNIMSVGGFVVAGPIAEAIVRGLGDTTVVWQGLTLQRYNLFYLGAAVMFTCVSWSGLWFSGKRSDTPGA